MPDTSQNRPPHKIVLLGATGSIGTQTIDVVRLLGPERARIIAVAARGSVSLLAEQAREMGAEFAAISDSSKAALLESELAESGIGVLSGEVSLVRLASLPEADTVVVAVSGAAGLLATMAAVEAGKRVCIATKEVLVAAGELVMDAARRHGATILPIDSEHSAIFQCIQGYENDTIAKLWITASGGPFRTWTTAQMRDARPEDALKHPVWSMGGKISVDSATLMNKGLELIEAHHLFGVGLDSIEVVVHPQSIVHSMVEMCDGALLCQMGQPDMRLPIQIALMHPEKIDTGLPRLRPDSLKDLTWDAPDNERFPAINIARRAAKIGGTAPAILNAANEVAVAAFLDGGIDFTEICALVAEALDALSITQADSIATVIAADRTAREWVEEKIANLSRNMKLTTAFAPELRRGAFAA